MGDNLNLDIESYNIDELLLLFNINTFKIKIISRSNIIISSNL